MKSYTLITGSSFGIGKEMALYCAQKGENLVLTARSLRQLDDLAKELSSVYSISAETIAQDLSRPEGARELFNKCKAKNLKIDCLINNAGFGENSPFLQSDFQKLRDMMNLNMVALTELCHLFGRTMAARGAGKILNVASTAAFLPGPYMSVYYATKSYVVSLSEGLNYELKSHGVSVGVLCPGPTATHFQNTAGMKQAKLIESLPFPSARKVAESAWRAIQSRSLRAVPGFLNKLTLVLAWSLPTRFILPLVARLQFARNSKRTDSTAP